jgi:hypothetical protein
MSAGQGEKKGEGRCQNFVGAKNLLGVMDLKDVILASKGVETPPTTTTRRIRTNNKERYSILSDPRLSQLFQERDATNLGTAMISPEKCIFSYINT